MIHPEFLPLLSRLMSQSVEHATVDPLYDQLYLGLTRDLPEFLEKNNYPDALAVIDDCKEFLEMTEVLIQYPEIVDRTVCHVRATTTAQSLRFVARQHKHDEILSLCTCKGHIPVPILLSSGEVLKLSAINYVGCRFPITFTEFQILIEGCKETGIALTRILRMFSLQIPQFPKDKAFICDHNFGTGRNLLKKYINYSLFYRQSSPSAASGRFTITTKGFHKVYVPKLTPQNIALYEEEFNCPVCEEGDLSKELSRYHPSYYGIRERLDAIFAPILSFYDRKESELKDFLLLIEKDAVRVNANLKSMNDLKVVMTNKYQIFSQGNKDIRSLEFTLRNAARDLSLKLQPENDLTRYVPRKVFDDIFVSLFAHSPKKNAAQEFYLNNLQNLGYSNLSLVKLYIEKYLNKKKDISYGRLFAPGIRVAVSTPTRPDYGTTWNPEALTNRIKGSQFPAYWEQAKMMLLMDADGKLTQEQKTIFVQRIPKKYVDSGCLLLALAQSAQGEERRKYLLRAVNMGYKPAMDQHFENCEHTAGELVPLMNQLHPESCIVMGDAFAGQIKENTPRNSAIFNSCMFYYKIAASAGSLEALNKIVTLIFQNYIAPHISRNGMKENRDVDQLCDLLLPLCVRLISKTVDTAENNMRLGTMLCYKDENLSGAAGALSGKTGALVDYCKGYMYQYGKYYATNLQKAKEYYSKSNTPAAQLALNAVNALIQKEEAEKEAKKATTYNEEKSYERSYSSSSYDDGWCFITTAACTALQGEDNCSELMLLRSFRDKNLRNSSEGSELVEEYYRVGPMIVAQLDALPNCREEYLSLWNNYIGPSCELIQENRLEEARDLYIAMTAMLCHRFHIAVNTNGFPTLRQKLQEKGISIY